MAANALQSPPGTAEAADDGSAPAPSATSLSTDEAVQASLARLHVLMESARAQVIASARLEAAAEGQGARAETHAPAKMDSQAGVAPPPVPHEPAKAEVPPEPATPAPPAAPAAVVQAPVVQAPMVQAPAPPAPVVQGAPASYVDDRVAAATAEIEARLRAAFDSRMDELSGDLAETQARMDAAEMRSLDAIEDLSRRLQETSQWASEAKAAESRDAETVDRLAAEVTRISEALEAGLERLDSGQSGALEDFGVELTRISESVEERLKQSETDQARALAGLDEKLERVSERLAERIGGADWRASQANEEMGDRLAKACERLSRDLIERVELGEGRLVGMIVERREEAPHDETAVEASEPRAAESYAGPAAWTDGSDDDAFPPAAFDAVSRRRTGFADVEPEATGGFLSAYSPLAHDTAPPSEPDMVADPAVESHQDWSMPPAAAGQDDEAGPHEAPKPAAKTGFWRGLF